MIAIVANVEKIRGLEMRGDGGVSMMDAFHARLSRHVHPRLNADGLVEHGISVANAKTPHSCSGADVDWILASRGPKTSGANMIAPIAQQQQQQGAASRKPPQALANGSGGSTFRPYRSAGKRLPWEVETAEDVATNTTAVGSNMVCLKQYVS